MPGRFAILLAASLLVGLPAAAAAGRVGMDSTDALRDYSFVTADVSSYADRPTYATGFHGDVPAEVTLYSIFHGAYVVQHYAEIGGIAVVALEPDEFETLARSDGRVRYVERTDGLIMRPQIESDDRFSINGYEHTARCTSPRPAWPSIVPSGSATSAAHVR